MKVTTEKLPDSQVLLNIEVDPETVEKAVERAYRSIAGRINVPGFRRGKAPRYMVERLVGREALVAEGIEKLVPEAYRQALKETGVQPIDEPQFDLDPNLEAATTEPLVFRATVPVEPTVTLGDYKSIRLAPVPVDVTPQMVNDTIESLREGQAAWNPVEREAKAGDQVVADVEGRVGTAPALYDAGGQPIISTVGGEVVFDQKAATIEVNPQQGWPAPAFHEQLVGLKAGGEKAFQVTLADDYPDQKLAGKTVTFKVSVSEVKEKTLPEVNDEFAKSVGEYETAEALREAVETSLRQRLETQSRQHYEDSVVREAVEQATVEIPPVLVSREIERQLRNLGNSLRQERLSLEQYLRVVGKSEDEVREELRPRAIDSLKNYLVLREIGRAEGIEVGDEDVSQEIDRLAGSVGEQENADRLRDLLSRPEDRADIQANLRFRRTIDRLTSYATPAEGEKTASEGADVETASAGEPADDEAKPETEATSKRGRGARAGSTGTEAAGESPAAADGETTPADAAASEISAEPETSANAEKPNS